MYVKKYKLFFDIFLCFKYQVFLKDSLIILGRQSATLTNRVAQDILATNNS